MLELNVVGRTAGDRTPMTGIDRWAIAANGEAESKTKIILIKPRRSIGSLPRPRPHPKASEVYRDHLGIAASRWARPVSPRCVAPCVRRPCRCSTVSGGQLLSRLLLHQVTR